MVTISLSQSTLAGSYKVFIMNIFYLLVFMLLICLPSSAAPAASKPVEFQDCANCPRMVVIPAGEFLMGLSQQEAEADAKVGGLFYSHFLASVDSKSLPRHLVKFSKPFALGKYDVTKQEFGAFVKETGYAPDNNCTIHRNNRYFTSYSASWVDPKFNQTDRDPVVCVSYADMQAYVAWLNKKIQPQRDNSKRDEYYIPSEAEWEYAARAGQNTTYWWGNEIGVGNADCDGCGSPWDIKSTAPVDRFPTNQFGVATMLGNVWQRVQDCWHPTYDGAPNDGSSWTSGDCSFHVIRGGERSSEPLIIRPEIRGQNGVDARNNYIGFRVAKQLN